MSSFNLSNNKLPLHLLEIIQALQEILGEQAYDFLLIGASARDLIMDSIYLPPQCGRIITMSYIEYLVG